MVEEGRRPQFEIRAARVDAQNIYLISDDSVQPGLGRTEMSILTLKGTDRRTARIKEILDGSIPFSPIEGFHIRHVLK